MLKKNIITHDKSVSTNSRYLGDEGSWRENSEMLII